MKINFKPKKWSSSVFLTIAMLGVATLSGCEEKNGEPYYDDKSLDDPYLFSEGYQDQIQYPYELATPLTDWLSLVRDDARVCKLSIPGTHDTMTGMGFYTPLVSVATGIAAELVWRAGGYRSSVAAVLAYAVLSVFIVGNYLPFFLDPSYLSSTGQKIGQGYVEAIRPFLQGWLIPAEAVACFVSGLVGGLIGRSVLRRHFQKAGIL